MFNKNNKDRIDGYNPFKALDPYSEEESDQFYGRDDEVQSLYYHVKQNYLTVLYGESGVGKSSIINAGLVPLLRTKNIFPILLRTSAILNQESPAKFILTQVVQEAEKRNYSLFDDYEGVIINPRSEEYLGKSLWEFFHQISFYKGVDGDDQFNANKNVPTQPLLIFDQFEEIFSAPVTLRKEDFLNELASLVENYPLQHAWHMDVSNEPPNCKILISLKSESIPKLGKLSSIIPSISQTRNKIMLDRLTDEQGGYIIDQLGNEKGKSVKFSKETVNHIINEIASYDDLGNLEKRKVQPYFLSLYCHEVYDNVINRKNKDTIQVSDLKNDTMLLRRFYNENTRHISRSTKRFVEKNLLNNGSRALFPKANLPEKHERGFDSLVTRKIIRLITFGDNQYYEIAHDKLAAIINENHKKNEAARKTWRNVAILLLVPFVIYLVAFFVQREKYNNENELYKSISMASKAESNWFALMDKDQQETVLATLKESPMESPEFNKLKRSYIAAIKAKASAEEHEYYLAAQLFKAAIEIDSNNITRDIARDSVFDRFAIALNRDFNLDGEGYGIFIRNKDEMWIISDKSLSVYQKDSGQQATLRSNFHGNIQSQVEFINTGGMVSVPIIISNYRFRDFRGLESITDGFPGLPSAIRLVDNTFLFIGTYGGDVYYYSTDNLKKRKILDTETSDRDVIAIAGTESYVAVSWTDGNIKIFPRDGEGYSSIPIESISGKLQVRDMVFTDDNRLFYGSDDYIAYLHEINKPENDVHFIGHDDYIISVDNYDSDENLLLTTSSDNTAIIWNDKGEPLYILKHGGDVYDGQILGSDSVITVSKDKKLYIWKLVEGKGKFRNEIVPIVDPLTNPEKEEFGIKEEQARTAAKEGLVSEQ